MGCGTKTKAKLMASIRKQYPRASLERRKRILGGILYRNKNKRK
jgi:hypothetical protein